MCFCRIILLAKWGVLNVSGTTRICSLRRSWIRMVDINTSVVILYWSRSCDPARDNYIPVSAWNLHLVSFILVLAYAFPRLTLSKTGHQWQRTWSHCFGFRSSLHPRRNCRAIGPGTNENVGRPSIHRLRIRAHTMSRRNVLPSLKIQKYN